jgi:5-methylcytosine-specific restriction endonuclease McrA
VKRLTTLKPKIAKVDLRRGSRVATERIRGYELTKIRERIALRDEYTCQICGRGIALDRGEVDHIVPLSSGGGNNEDNLQWICREPCHREKSEREEKERA